MIRAVLFDMDGLLLDSERLAIRACVAAGQKCGYPVTEEMALQMLGITREASLRMYREVFPNFDPAPYAAAFDEFIFSTVEKDGIALMPGARELLDDLAARGIPRALASSSPVERIELYLRKAGISDAFNAVVCGGEVLHSKPAPDSFLLAAEKLSAAPGDCFVLEDSPNGVRAGRAGGMIVAMIPDLIPFSEALRPYCDYVLPSLRDVIPVIAERNGWNE